MSIASIIMDEYNSLDELKIASFKIPSKHIFSNDGVYMAFIFEDNSFLKINTKYEVATVDYNNKQFSNNKRPPNVKELMSLFKVKGIIS